MRKREKCEKRKKKKKMIEVHKNKGDESKNRQHTEWGDERRSIDGKRPDAVKKPP